MSFLRRYFAGGVCTSEATLVGKTVLVVGANKGIGLETALDIARRGARLIIACRNQERGQKALGMLIKFVFIFNSRGNRSQIDYT